MSLSNNYRTARILLKTELELRNRHTNPSSLKKALSVLYSPITIFKYLPLLNPKRIFLPKVEAIITLRCSLNCRDCTAMVPQYVSQAQRNAESLWESNVQDLISDIQKLLSAVDGIGLFTLVGGEPFAHPNLDELLKFLASAKKIRNAQITTNGTIIPNKNLLDILKNNGIRVTISNYGDNLSKKMPELVRIFSNLDIPYRVNDFYSGKWLDTGTTEPKGRTAETLHRFFAGCGIRKYCRQIYKKRLYVCFRAAHLTELGLKEEDRSEFVDLGMAEEDIRRDIEKAYSLPYISSCDRCDFPCRNSVEAAVQVHKTELG